MDILAADVMNDGHHYEKADNMRIQSKNLTFRVIDIREYQLAQVLEIEGVKSEERRPL